MAYFSHELARDKLSILYILEQLDIGLTRQQCIDIMLANGWANYFNVATALTELEEDGMIAAIPRAYGQAYRITHQALDMLNMFRARIPITLRDSYDAYIQENRKRLMRETQVISSIEQQPSGSYLVSLKVVEANQVLLKVDITAPSHEHANAAVNAWPKASEGIYHYLVTSLMKLDEKQETNDD